MIERNAAADLEAFDCEVPDDGYVWWYLDAVSDDGQHGLTLIAFVGSVFSPYYARARRQGPADPQEFCALNVALYGVSHRRWALSEYRREAVSRSAKIFRLGRSQLSRTATGLQIRVDERCVPMGRALRGTVELETVTRFSASRLLDSRGHHQWCVLAPFARVSVSFDQPRLAWQGAAYLDTNRGSAPLERDLRHWTWLRTVEQGATTVLYDVVDRNGKDVMHALRFLADGSVHTPAAGPTLQATTRTGWGIRRPVRSDPESPPGVIATLEDTPFYNRSRMRLSLGGQALEAVHESLDLDRFASRWVQVLLPFKTRRAKSR